MSKRKSFFHSNIRFLRELKEMSQEELANVLAMSRNKLQALESGKTINPAIKDVIDFSNYFAISTDSLLKVDLKKSRKSKLEDIQCCGDEVFLSGVNMRVLAVTVDKENNENVEYVSVRAKAGYISSYTDPEYISSLPRLNMPFLPKGKTYRAFILEGDSMLPYRSGDVVITEYVEDWRTVKSNTLCMVITRSDQQFAFKLITNLLKENQCIRLESLNKVFNAYDVHASEILEIWKYHSFWSNIILEPSGEISEILKLVKETNVSLQEWKRNG